MISNERWCGRRLVWCAMMVLVLGLRLGAAESVAGNLSTNQVRSIVRPLQPLPPEAESAGVRAFSFIVYGDTRGRRDGKQLQYEHSLIIDSMLERISELEKTRFPVRFVLQSGDAVVDGRDARHWNVSFIELINRITGKAGIPYFLAPGNHDVTGSDQLDSADRKTGLSNYLAAVAHLIPADGAPRRLEGYPSFAFGYGNGFFIALDSNIAGDKTQYEWVSGQLAGLDRHRYEHIFAFFHHPPFSSGPHGGAIIERPAAELRKIYLPLFRKHHVRALLAGHEHLFEHWVERYEDGDGVKRRLDHIVTGGGGGPLYGYRGTPDTRDYVKTNAAEKVVLEHLVKPGPKAGDNPYHYVVVRVDGAKLGLEVVAVDWGKDFQPYRSARALLEDVED